MNEPIKVWIEGQEFPAAGIAVEDGMVEIEIEDMWPNERREDLRVELLGRSLVGTMTEWSIESDGGGWIRPRFTVCAPVPDPS